MHMILRDTTRRSIRFPHISPINMELLEKPVRDELFGARDIYTKVRDSAPSKYGDDFGGQKLSYFGWLYR